MGCANHARPPDPPRASGRSRKRVETQAPRPYQADSATRNQVAAPRLGIDSADGWDARSKAGAPSGTELGSGPMAEMLTVPAVQRR